MKRLGAWIGKTALIVLLLYFFSTLAAALWLTERLKFGVLARDPFCWSHFESHVDGPAKYRHRPRVRDWLVIRDIIFRDGSSPPTPWWHLRNAALVHVYSTYWPETERRRLFEAIAAEMRPCRYSRVAG